MADIRPFCMPKWGIEMTEGTIAEWMVKEGDTFTRGQLLCLIETAKITNEVEAEYDAVARRVLVGAGEDAQPVGTLLAVFADASASDDEIQAFIDGFKPAETKVAAQASAPAAQAAPAAEVQSKPAAPKKIVTNRPISPEALRLAEEYGVELDGIDGSGRNGRITYQDVHQAIRPAAHPALRGVAVLPEETGPVFASPLARRLAVLHGIDLSSIKGTGARGRVCKADVLALVPSPSSAAGAFGQPFVAVDNTPEVVPFDRIRKVVAQRLTRAKQELPHFYLRLSARADALLELRKTANLVLGCKASINDYLIKAVALAFAVASPKGLVTPIVRQADRMRIDQLAAETRRLIDKATAGNLGFEDMDGGTFSVSNLGMFGIEQFDAIINPPQAAILAVGTVMRQAAETASGGVAFESRIALTLSVDHRAIDGAVGARFMETLQQLIEEPAGLFA